MANIISLYQLCLRLLFNTVHLCVYFFFFFVIISISSISNYYFIVYFDSGGFKLFMDSAQYKRYLGVFCRSHNI